MPTEILRVLHLENGDMEVQTKTDGNKTQITLHAGKQDVVEELLEQARKAFRVGNYKACKRFCLRLCGSDLLW